MNAPRYERPTSVTDAVATLEAEPRSRPIAGGTDLMMQLRLGRTAPPVLVVDTLDLAELRRIDHSDGTILGAATSMRAILADPRLRHSHPALAEAARLLGGPQIQAMATVGGNLCNASPAAETATPLLVADAVLEVASGHGRRRLGLDEFFLGPGRTALAPGELLVAVHLPTPPADNRSAYRRIELRRSVDIAVVSASASLDVEDGRVVAARIAVGAAHAVPIRVTAAENQLIGSDVSASGPHIADMIGAATQACREAVRPIDDKRASAAYRAAMVEVTVRRVLVDCLTPRPET